jgi:hypothetical protein
MRCEGTGGVTVGNPEVEEVGHPEDVEDPAGTEAGGSLEAEEVAAAASEANKPLSEIVLYIFFLTEKNCQKT